MNSRRDIEICARNEARAGCPTPPCDQGGDSPLDLSTSGSPWQATGHINRSSFKRPLKTRWCLEFSETLLGISFMDIKPLTPFCP
jgi:hypothetical protein